MQRRHLGAVTSLIFAAFWAFVWWRWTADGHSEKILPVPALSCAYFVVASGGIFAGQRWARWLGLVAAIVLLALLSIVVVGGYVISLFGDQVLGLSEAAPFLAGMALSVVLIVLLARPLDFASPVMPAGSVNRNYHVWVPVVFTAAYVTGSWALGTFVGSGTWNGLAQAIGLDVALLLIALPSTVLVWLTWAWWSRGKVVRPLGVLMVAGAIIPLAVAGLATEIVTSKETATKQRTEHQLANAHLSEVTDELLLSERGNPIGIRLRYTVRYADGLDDKRYRPIVSVRFDSPFVEMWPVRSQIDPAVGAQFDAREYSVTEDFIPMYFPGFMRFPDAPQRSDDKCFYWGRPSDREIAKDSETHHATINMSFATGPEQASKNRTSTTRRIYSQGVFFSAALREGARDCQ